MKISISFILSCLIVSLNLVAQTDIPKADIRFENIGAIQPRNALKIKSSYLSIGCEVLDRDFANYDSYKEHLGNLGVKHARFQSGWAKTEQKEGKYDFEWLDKIIDDCRSKGIQPWVTTCYGNPVYDGGGSIQSSSKLPDTEEALNAWDVYIEKLVSHFKNRVFEWEIWNEPNHGVNASTPEQYAAFFIRTAQIIRRGQPEGKIIALALSGVKDTSFVRGFLRHVKENGKLNLIDEVTFHGYPNNPDSDFDKVEALKNLLKEYNPKILARQGETGCPSTYGSSGAMGNYPFTELIQAKWDMRRALAYIGRGIPFSLFTLSEFNYPGNRLNTKGKLKIDLDLNIVHVKQSYYAYQNLTSMFDSTIVAMYPHDCKIESDSVTSVFVFTDVKGDLAVAAYWNSQSVPSGTLEMQNALVKLDGADFNIPVLVDVRTGQVYEIPESAVSKNNGFTAYQLPVYDSPLLLCDKDFLMKRGLLKTSVKRK